MDLYILDKIDNLQFKYIYNKLSTIIRNAEIQVNNSQELVKCNNNINIKKISKRLVDHWNYLTNKEKQNFLNQFIEYIIVENESSLNHIGKSKIINIKFYN
jgi:hypothetical protein